MFALPQVRNYQSSKRGAVPSANSECRLIGVQQLFERVHSVGRQSQCIRTSEKT